MLALQEKTMLMVRAELGWVLKGRERMKGVGVWMEGQRMKGFFYGSQRSHSKSRKRLRSCGIKGWKSQILTFY